MFILILYVCTILVIGAESVRCKTIADNDSLSNPIYYGTPYCSPIRFLII